MLTSRLRVMRAAHARMFSSSVPSWATLDPMTVSGSNPCTLQNLVAGKWTDSKKYLTIPDPMNGEGFIRMPDTQIDELKPFIDDMRSVPKSGLHNPLKNPERYVNYGEISFKAAAALQDPEIEDFFIKLIQRVMPKSRTQALAEVHVSRIFLKNFSGDSVRFMAQGFNVSGDHLGQESRGYRWPFGPVALIAPFNFPLEIPVLQLMGCLYMGNKPIVKGSEKTSLVLEQYVRLLHHCGMPLTDMDLIHCQGQAMEQVILKTPVRLTQFTGSSAVAERLCEKTRGKMKIEDAGFDWKIIGPDVNADSIDYVSYVCDQDAYAMSGQKCSAQSICFAHSNAVKAGLFDKMKALASRRSIEELTISPVLSLTTQNILDHKDKVLKIPGARVLFGGKALDPNSHSIPECYGAVEPTAVFVPLKEMLATQENLDLCTTEIFGPFQIVTEYNSDEVDKILEVCEKMSHHLTCAVVTNDAAFRHKILSNTVNGTTYHGIRARTTGAPANHWFGPAGDPRGAGIGTPEAIRLVWSCHREIIQDDVPVPKDWKIPEKAT